MRSKLPRASNGSALALSDEFWEGSLVAARSRLRDIAAAVGLAVLMFGATGPARAQDQGVGVVSVEGGQILGVETDVRGVQVFKGIPFGGSTGGENRFKPPQPVVPWSGIRTADKWGDQVLQDPNTNPVGSFWGDEFYFDSSFSPQPSENGLNLNVWTPAGNSSEKLPVYVWIHGGGNHHGNASEIEFYASKLAAKGIVVVSVQYRTGVLGFLALPELSAESPHKVSGNYATLDLIQALQWVRGNVSGFGGDPANVTIGGQSAGGLNVAMLLRTPLARGLFHRAVLESTILGLFPWPATLLAEREKANAEGIQKVFGKSMSLAELRKIPTEDFLKKKAADGTTPLYEALHKATNAPAQYAIDGYVFPKDDFDILRPGALNGIDIMIGGASDEFTSLFGGPEKTLSDSEFADAMTKLGYSEDWRKVYRPSDPRQAYRMSLRARSDNALQNYLLSAGLGKERNTDFNVYAYYFSHVPPGRDSEFYGSYHSSDLWYFMNSLRNSKGQRFWTSADFRMAETMSSYLANFVKTGNPNDDGLPEWPQATKSTGLAFMNFKDGGAFAATATPFPERDTLNRLTVSRTQNLQGDRLFQ